MAIDTQRRAVALLPEGTRARRRVQPRHRHHSQIDS